MKEIEQLEGEEKIRALEKAIAQYEGDNKALQFIERAMEYYKGDPKAIPFVDKAIELRKEDIKTVFIIAPILIVAGWVWSSYIIPWLRFPTRRMKLVVGFWLWDLFGKLAILVGLLIFVIGVPYFLYKYLGLKRLRHRLTQLNE
jgi:hypothetical protein